MKILKLCWIFCIKIRNFEVMLSIFHKNWKFWGYNDLCSRLHSKSHFFTDCHVVLISITSKKIPKIFLTSKKLKILQTLIKSEINSNQTTLKYVESSIYPFFNSIQKHISLRVQSKVKIQEDENKFSHFVIWSKKFNWLAFNLMHGLQNTYFFQSSIHSRSYIFLFSSIL